MLCVIVHIYYQDFIHTLKGYLNSVDLDHYLYITTSSELLHIVREEFPKSISKSVENRGEDIGAFLNVLNDIDLNKYDNCIKIHSKKDRFWTQDLLDCIMKDTKTFQSTIDSLSRKMMVGSVKRRLNHIGENEKWYKYLCEKFNYQDTPRPPFISGTMFACNIDVLNEIKKVGIQQSEFEEGYALDSRKEHAFERFFSKIVISLGGEVYYV